MAKSAIITRTYENHAVTYNNEGWFNATEAARQWQGWGTALKPALEPITMARKPLVGTVAENVLAYGTGALNIDGCRVGGVESPSVQRRAGGAPKMSASMYRDAAHNHDQKRYEEQRPGELLGRWPANLLHDGSDEVVAGFPVTAPAKAGMRGIGLTGDDVKVYGKGNPDFDTARGHNDNGGSAARFFYCAKASKRDRDEGLQHMVDVARANGERSEVRESGPRKNHHPTVKPTDLMRYLLRLVTPPGGVALDPFMGSGSTGKAAILEGFGFIGIEREAEYLAIARARIAHAATPLFT